MSEKDGIVSANKNGSEATKNDQIIEKQKSINTDRDKSWRRGKWTIEEQEYSMRLIEEFKNGLIHLEGGKTLRTYLSEKLNCDPMRISKKYTGVNSIGKQAFKRRSDADKSMTPEQKLNAHAELAFLRQRFLERISCNAETEKKIQKASQVDRRRAKKKTSNLNFQSSCADDIVKIENCLSKYDSIDSKLLSKSQRSPRSEQIISNAEYINSSSFIHSVLAENKVSCNTRNYQETYYVPTFSLNPSVDFSISSSHLAYQINSPIDHVPALKNSDRVGVCSPFIPSSYREELCLQPHYSSTKSIPDISSFQGATLLTSSVSNIVTPAESSKVANNVRYKRIQNFDHFFETTTNPDKIRGIQHEQESKQKTAESRTVIPVSNNETKEMNDTWKKLPNSSSVQDFLNLLGDAGTKCLEQSFSVYMKSNQIFTSLPIPEDCHTEIQPCSSDETTYISHDESSNIWLQTDSSEKFDISMYPFGDSSNDYNSDIPIDSKSTFLPQCTDGYQKLKRLWDADGAAVSSEDIFCFKRSKPNGL